MIRKSVMLIVMTVVVAITVSACSKKTPPVARPTQPAPTSGTGTNTPPPSPPEPVSEPVPVPAIPEEAVAGRSLDELNRDSPLKAVFYELDSAEITPDGLSALQENAKVLKQFGTWQITIEGHCDERGTAEYNLGLGERRANAARDYLVSLGIPVIRLKTVSYGKEFPFDPAHTETAWAKNRRAHFVITAK